MKIKLFYGWYIVIAGLILTTYYSAIFTYGYTAFINPIVATFNWNMTEIALATSISMVIMAAFNPFLGNIVDRYDPKKLMIIGVVICAVGMFIISRTVNLAMYYAGFFVMGLGSSLCAGMIQTATISRWFKKKLGRATGIYFMGLALGGVCVPLLIIILDNLGWQTTLMFAAIIFCVLGIGLAFVYRKRPEQYGMLPDGAKSEEEAAGISAAVKVPAVALTAKQALRTRRFWQFTLVTFIQQSTLGATTIFIVPYLTSEGLSRTFAGTIVSILTIASMCSRIPLGMMADKFKKKYVVSFTLVLMVIGLGIYWLLNIDSPFWLFLIFAVIFGIGIGGINVLRPPVLVEYFGSKNFGAIMGINNIAAYISVMAQPFAGWTYDTFHSYKPTWLVLIGCCLLAVILMMTIPEPGKYKKDSR
jgi:MFS family permease